MKKKEFKNYLKDICLLKKGTVASRVSNLKRIEKVYGDLDKLYEKDSFNDLLQELSHEEGEKEQYKIDIKGDQCTGFRTLKSALGLYLDFKIYEIDNQNIEIKIQTSPKQFVKDYRKKIISALDQITYKKKEYSKNVGKLQADIIDVLKEKKKQFVWEMEKKYQINIMILLIFWGMTKISIS